MKAFYCILVYLCCIVVVRTQYCPLQYVIQNGDTCYQIAADRNLNVEDILWVNPGINCYNLQIGQLICLPYSLFPFPLPPLPFPGYPQPPPPPPLPLFPLPPPPPPPILPYPTCFQSHTVRQGDICYTIAQIYGIRLEELFYYNPGINCNSLQIGQQVCIRAY